MAKHPKKQKFFWIDDVWVTGFLAGDLNITHLDMIEVQIRELYNNLFNF